MTRIRTHKEPINRSRLDSEILELAYFTIDSVSSKNLAGVR